VHKIDRPQMSPRQLEVSDERDFAAESGRPRNSETTKAKQRWKSSPAAAHQRRSTCAWFSFERPSDNSALATRRAASCNRLSTAVEMLAHRRSSAGTHQIAGAAAVSQSCREHADSGLLCSQSVAKWAYIGGRWPTFVESDPRPKYATVYEIRRLWTVVEHRPTQLEMWCPVSLVI
jgi:hypothetical protein